MWSRVQRWFPGVSGLFAGALLLGVGLLAFVAWDQSYWWRLRDDYGFGWIVPLFVAFVVWDRWGKIAAAHAACVTAGSPRATGVARWALAGAAGAAFAGGALLFLLGSFYRAGAGPSSPGTLAITMGAVAMLLPLIFLHAPATEGARAARWWDDARVRLTALFLFPALVWLVSAPMVSAVETELKLLLLRKVVAVVAFVFVDVLGLPIEQQGNVLVLPTGRVGVEEACSGIRSLTACLFAGSFMAAVFVEGPVRKATVVVASMGFALFTNLLRGLFLTGWAYNYGSAAIEGTVHDVAGYAVLGITVAGLFLLVKLMELQRTPPADGAAS
ncbi:MAG: hypothetical protein RLZZ15_939 [Verrucomicrobiota bacterium]|jgi:exosortase/archaeosortase family protein